MEVSEQWERLAGYARRHGTNPVGGVEGRQSTIVPYDIYEMWMPLSAARRLRLYLLEHREPSDESFLVVSYIIRKPRDERLLLEERIRYGDAREGTVSPRGQRYLAEALQALGEPFS